MPPSFFSGCSIRTIGLWRPTWTSDALQKWIEYAGGQYERRVGEDTTHVVVTEKEWTAQTQAVKDAIQAKQSGRPELRIVTFDWLDECLDQRCKKKEKPYEWTVRQAETSSLDINKESAVRSSAGLIKEAFCTSTEKYVDHKALRRLEKLREEEQRIKEVEDDERKQEFQLQLSKVDNLTMKISGIECVDNKLLEETHNIVYGVSGFPYDVVLTRQDLLPCGQIEHLQLKLQIWVSVKEPHAYAVIINAAGTSRLASASKVIALGCPWPTALRAFKKAFCEKSFVKWDDRDVAVSHDKKSFTYRPYKKMEVMHSSDRMHADSRRTSAMLDTSSAQEPIEIHSVESETRAGSSDTLPEGDWGAEMIDWGYPVSDYEG